MAFDPRQAREAMPTELSLFPDGGGRIGLDVDEGDGALGLTIGDVDKPDSEATVWLGHPVSGELHLWLTAVVSAVLVDTEAPDLFDTTDLSEGQELSGVYAPEDDGAPPVSIEAVDTDGNGCHVLLTVDDTKELHSLLTAVLLGTGALT